MVSERRSTSEPPTGRGRRRPARRHRCRRTPDPDWAGIERLLLDCQSSDSGVSLLTLGPEDIDPCDEHMQAHAFMTVMPDGRTLKLPIMASYAELLTDASYQARSPSSYPIMADLRWRLLEGKLLLFRFVVWKSSEPNSRTTGWKLG